jgi:hypothetical protein
MCRFHHDAHQYLIKSLHHAINLSVAQGKVRCKLSGDIYEMCKAISKPDALESTILHRCSPVRSSTVLFAKTSGSGSSAFYYNMLVDQSRQTATISMVLYVRSGGSLIGSKPWASPARKTDTRRRQTPTSTRSRRHQSCFL